MVYAVIETGGKQYKVAEGDTLDIELVSDGKIDLKPILLIDGKKVLASQSELSKVKIPAKVVGETKGPKITGFTYKSKSRTRRRYGHRQKYTTIEVGKISKGTTKTASE